MAGSLAGYEWRDEQDSGMPVSVEQIAAALAALGVYRGANTPEDQAARLGGADAYRVRVVNALLGRVQSEAALADGVALDDGARCAAWEEQLKAAGAGLDDPARRAEFLRWQVLRVGTPLRLMAQNREAGPIPVAAAQAAIGLHLLLGVVAASQDAIAQGDVGCLAAQTGRLRAARDALQGAIGNTDILLNMLKSVGLLERSTTAMPAPGNVRRSQEQQTAAKKALEAQGRAGAGARSEQK